MRRGQHSRWASRARPHQAALWSVAALLAGPVGATEVPSGQPVTLQEVLIDSVGAEQWLRFRFVAQDLAADSDFEAMAQDMMHLCETFSLPYMAAHSVQGDVIVISLADRLTEFGVATPEATQVFEAFRPMGETCIWEGL